MLRSIILTALKCVGLVLASILFVFMVLVALGFSTYTIFENSYELPGRVSVGAGFVFAPMYKETVLTEPTWLKKPEVGDEIVYERLIKVGKIYCIGKVEEAIGDTYFIEHPREIHRPSITIGNMTPISFCNPIVNVKDVKGVVVLRAEERDLLPSLIAFIATLSSAFSILLSHFILRKRRA